MKGGVACIYPDNGRGSLKEQRPYVGGEEGKGAVRRTQSCVGLGLGIHLLTSAIKHSSRYSGGGSPWELAFFAQAA